MKADQRDQAVDRHRPGVVGHDQRAALSRDVFRTEHFDSEVLLRDRPDRRQDQLLGQLRVEAKLVHGVITGQTAAYESEELGRTTLPVGSEHLLGSSHKRGNQLADRDPLGGVDAR